MNIIKERFSNSFNKLKDKFFNKIDKTKFIEQEFKFNLINLILTVVTLVAAITCIVTSTSSSDKSTSIGLVYGFYLPFALANCIMCEIVAACCIKRNQKTFFKQWYYYMHAIVILIEAIILPIPLNLITRFDVNAGMLWSIIVFAFMAVFAAFASFIWVYKITLVDPSYVLDENPEDDNPNNSNNKNDDQKEEIINKKEQPVKVTTLPFKTKMIDDEPKIEEHYDDVKKSIGNNEDDKEENK